MLFIVRPAFEEMNFYYVFPVIFSLGFANVAISSNLSKPNITEYHKIEIKKGRHIIIEKISIR